MTQLRRNGGDTGHPVGGYDLEFKRRAVAMVEDQGRVMAEVARELGISAPTLLLWRRKLGQAKEQASGPAAATLEQLQAENSRLRAENDRLHLREEVLKKTLGILVEAPRSGTPGSKR